MSKIGQNKEVVQEIKNKLAEAGSVVLVKARGLSVAQDTELRKDLRENGVYYKVYKNSLMALATEGTEFEPLKDYLKGPTAVAISYEDITAGARVLNKYIKIIPVLEFKAGIIEGNLYEEDKVKAFANIPAKEELLSKLLGSFKSPLASFARVINAISESKA